MATLKLIADEITGALNRPFDIFFRERLMSDIRHELALEIRRSIEKSGIDDIFKTKFKVPVNKYINTNGVLFGADDEHLYRTINKVPEPIRYKTDEPFLWVGDVNGRVTYIYTTMQELLYADLQPAYVGQVDTSLTPDILFKPIRYMYQNGYIYLFNYVGEEYKTEPPIGGTPPPEPEEEPTYILGIEGVFGVTSIITPEDTLNGVTITENTELPIPEDMIQIVKLRLLQGELSIIDNRDKVTPEHIDNI